jgi:hypothetical protein
MEKVRVTVTFETVTNVTVTVVTVTITTVTVVAVSNVAPIVVFSDSVRKCTFRSTVCYWYRC